MLSELKLGADIDYGTLNGRLEAVKLGWAVLEGAQTCKNRDKTDQNGHFYLPLTT